jgi:hypothetical protein
MSTDSAVDEAGVVAMVQASNGLWMLNMVLGRDI